MTRPARRTIQWRRRPRKEQRGNLAQPPDFLGTWQWRQPARFESVEDWPARTRRQREMILAGAASWLGLGKRVRMHPDPRLGGADIAGRIGTIHRICSSVFADYAVVHVPPTGRQKVARTRMLPLEILEPVE